MKPTVGLTGGIASGKSAVAQILSTLGVAVVDADSLAREIVMPGTNGLREIVNTFGNAVLNESGELDRKVLGAVVFGDVAARSRLNAITHPRIAALSAERLAALQDSTAPYLVYEAALLVEGGLHRAMAALVVVTSPAETQVERIEARDGLTREEAGARIEAQLPTEKKVEVADHVIGNDGDLAQLRARTEDVHRMLLQRFGLTP
jgi:dephospho-CoA kinase